MRIPRKVQIEVTNRCNISCKDCPQKSYPRGDMDWDLFKKIADSINFDTVVALWGNGEPLMRADYLRMAEYIDWHKDTPWTITTNGIRLNDHAINVFCKSPNLYQVIISIDSVYYDNFAELRPGASLLLVKKNLRALIARKEETGATFKIGVKLTEKGQDYEEIEKFIFEYIDQVDYVIIGRSLGQMNFNSLRKAPCRYFDDMIMEIRWDGKLIPCAYNHNAAEKGAIDLGYIQDFDSVLDAFNSDKYRELRAMHYEGDFPYPCNMCASPYTGDGFQGKVSFRNDDYKREMYYSEDFSNKIYSLEPLKGGTSRERKWTKDLSIVLDRSKVFMV